MTRTDDDSWDIATSVGATAVMVAMARAAETAGQAPLIRDQFAQVLVSTPELDQVRERVEAWWSASPDEDLGQDAADGRVVAQNMIDSQAVRTHFFDAFFGEAAKAGIRQHVILAAGLDSRAYRLDWPEGTVIYEIDVPKVLDYKNQTLAAHGAEPAAIRRPVPVDLRHDWPQALRDSGFDATRPTAWLAEGLLPFLPGAAQEAMFASVDELSAPGSQAAIEVFGVDRDQRADVSEKWTQVRAAREQRGQDVSFDPLELWFDDDGRPDCVEWFAGHGWRTRSVDSREESARLGREQPSVDVLPYVVTYVTAIKP